MAKEYNLFDIRSAAYQEVRNAVRDINIDEFVNKVKERVYQDFPDFINKSTPKCVEKSTCVGITIVFKNGDVVTYTEDEYTDYKYDGKVFVVIREEQWIGLFNIDAMEYITVGK